MSVHNQDLVARLRDFQQQEDDLLVSKTRLSGLTQDFTDYFWDAQRLLGSIASAHSQNHVLSYCFDELIVERKKTLAALEESYENIRAQISEIDITKSDIQKELIKHSESTKNTSAP